MKQYFRRESFVWLFCGFLLLAAACTASEKPSVTLTREQVEEIVLRSYQYVAMFNVNNKLAMDTSNPMRADGVNRFKANTVLADHTLKAIARPNNDTWYGGALLDLRAEPVILETPAIDSKYVSLMVTGYDHYVNIPMSTRLGDFSKPSRILFYTERTQGYSGARVSGVDKIVEMTGDFVSAIYRVMPHVNDPARMQRIMDAMHAINVKTLSQYESGEEPKTHSDAEFPDYGKTDFDVFEKNLLEVMQFVFNHTTFDSNDELDQKLVAVYEPLGVVPGRAFDTTLVADIDGALFREVAETIASQQLARAADPDDPDAAENSLKMFLPKGQMPLDKLVFQSVIGPIGVPATEAVYPLIVTTEGTPMSATHDYVIRMKKDELPPATAFWSATLYDTKNGFFIPNDRKKYSVGENSGFRLDADGGIDIHIAAQQRDGVPDENWLPTNRGDYGIAVQLRVYAPDLERYKTWTWPKAERVK